jgi:hypothetical protein
VEEVRTKKRREEETSGEVASPPSMRIFPCVSIDFLKHENIRSWVKELLEGGFFNIKNY